MSVLARAGSALAAFALLIAWVPLFGLGGTAHAFTLPDAPTAHVTATMS